MTATVHPQIADGSAALLVVSGKMGSGKDTVAPLAAAALGYPWAVHMYYADALKDEVDEILALLRGGACDTRIAVTYDVDVTEVADLRGLLADVGPAGHARTRSPQMRRALQYWGTDVRRAKDTDYWVNITAARVMARLDAGDSVYLTDARFPNEVERMAAIGGYTVRLHVSDEERLRRLIARDGVAPDSSALNHVSETALDGFDGFALVVDNDGSLTEVAATIVAGYPVKVPA